MAARGPHHNGVGMRRSSATSTLILAAAMALAGCNDIPFYGRNTPVEEARVTPPLQVATVSAEPGVSAGEPLPDIRVGGQSWVASGELYELPDAILVPAGSVGGRVFYALSWDAAPYDRLFVVRPDRRWQVYRPLVGGDRASGEERSRMEGSEAGAAAGGEAARRGAPASDSASADAAEGHD